MADKERFADIQQLYDDYIDYLLRENIIAKIYVLDKFQVMPYCKYEDGEIDIVTWQYGTEREIVQNKSMFDCLVDNGYYETTDEILEMHKAIIDREYQIKACSKMREEC